MHWLPCSLVSIVALLSVPGHASVVASSETGFLVRLVADVAKSPQESWEALIVPSGWWSSEHTYSGDATNLSIDARAMGCFCERLPVANNAASGSLPGSVEHMRVILAQPRQMLRLSGGLGPLQSQAVSGTLTVTLKSISGGTRITWDYAVGGYMTYKGEQIGPIVDKVLGEQLDRLARKLGPLGGEVRKVPDDGKGKP